MAQSAKNPTFQKSGGMGIWIQNETAASIRLLSDSIKKPVELDYLPVNSPPPEWDKRDWKVERKIPKLLPPKPLSQILTGDRMVPGGLYRLVCIKDRGPDKVPLGKTVRVIFNLPFIEETKLFVDITGVEEGSICTPGVGLYNLSEHPDAWTYISPPTFEGSWGYSWFNSFFIGKMGVRVEYAPIIDAHQSGQVSNFLFTIEGTSVTILKWPWNDK